MKNSYWGKAPDLISDRRRLRDLTTISEISLKLTSELEPDSLFYLVVFYASVLLEADKAVLCIIDPETNKHMVKAVHGYDNEHEMLDKSCKESFNTEWMTEKTPFAVVQPKDRPKLPFLNPGCEWEAIVVPVSGKREAIGALIVEDKLSGESFSAYDGEILNLLAAQAGIAIENARLYKEQDRLVRLRTRDLEAERNKSEQLLLNILPEEVYRELKERGRVTPKRHDSVTILFADFVDFSAHAEKISPEELIDDLETCYAIFDEIVETRSLEKLKTIGDSYMCAGGLTVLNENHAMDCVQAGLDMVESIKAIKQARKALGMNSWDVRVGIHTGPVVAGVIGQTKFTYDVWGDAVNLASRMEANGIPNQVNISEAAYLQVKKRFQCDPRGMIRVKGIGKTQMYLVKGLKDPDAD
ncbi:MAG: GAF domain-containing protein [Desulfatibacillum sp.]|nr:GAF domain-containing protein [Desulfatibacillum sp.]